MLQVVHYCPCAQGCLSSIPEWLPTSGPHHSGHEMFWEADQGWHLCLLTSLHGPAAVHLPAKKIYTVSQVLHSSLSHLESRKGGYVRMLFIDFSSPKELGWAGPEHLDLRWVWTPPLCSWILDFLTTRPQVIRVGRHTSRSPTLNTGSPQGHILSPLLYSLYTHDCVARSSSNTIIKFTDDSVGGPDLW